MLDRADGRAGLSKRIGDLNLGQRIVLVIAWGAALRFVGLYLMRPRLPTRWFAYAPLTHSTYYLATGYRPWVRLAVWLVLLAVWAAGSLFVLRGRARVAGEPPPQ